MILASSAALLGLSLPFLGGVAAHPCHKTLVTVEYDVARGALECSLWVWPTDLAEELTARSGKRVDIDKLESKKKLDGVLQAWIADVLRVRDKDGKRLRATWVGKELEFESCWLHFEYAVGKKLAHFDFENRAFFAIAEQPIHTVTFQRGATRKAKNLTRKVARWRLGLADLGAARKKRDELRRQAREKRAREKQAREKQAREKQAREKLEREKQSREKQTPPKPEQKGKPLPPPPEKGRAQKKG